jgi:hypothetical protein
MANKIEVSIEVDPGGKGQAAINQIDDKIKNVGKGGTARDAWDDLIAGAKRAEAKVGDIEDAIEDSFVKSKASATSFTDTFVRGLTQAQRQALSLQQSSKNLGTDGARISAQAAQLQGQFGKLYSQLSTGKPLLELNKELDDARLKLERLNQQAFTLRSQKIAEPSAGSQRVPGLSSAASLAGSQLGLPGLGTLTSLSSAGGVAAGVGVGVAAYAGIRELIRVSDEAKQSQLDLAAAARSTGRSFGEAYESAKTFREELAASKEESIQLAAAFGQLQVRSGGIAKSGDEAKLATLAKSQGLNSQQAAQAISGLAQGSKSAYEQLTGLDADLALDKYAKAANRTASELTQLERVQALYTSAVARSNDVTNIGADKLQTLGSGFQSLLNKATDAVNFFNSAAYNTFLQGISFGQFGGPEKTYQDKLKELGADDATQGEENRRQAANYLFKRQAQERQMQETQARGQGDFFSNFDRTNRAKPEDYQAGLSPSARLKQDIQESREQRALLEKAFADFQKNRANYSSDAAKSIEGTYKDKIQATIDQTRANLQSLASDAAAAAKKAAEEAAAAAKKVADDAQASISGLFDFLKSHTGRDNPYVAIYSEAAAAAESFKQTSESLRQQFGAAADEIIGKYEELTKAKQAALAENALSQRFSDRLDAQSYRDEAQALRSAPTAQSAASQEDSTYRPESARQVLQMARGEASARAAKREWTNSRFAMIGPDSPLAPKGAYTEEDEKLRGLVGAVDQGKIFADPAQYAAQHFKFTQDEKFRALVNAKDAGKFIGDPAGVFNPRATAQAASRDVLNARNAARLISQTEREAVAQGIDPAAARKLADEQILTRIKGRVSDSDLRSNTDLRELVAGALERKAGRFDSRESDAAKLTSEQDADIKGLAADLKSLISEKGLKVDAGPAATINVHPKSDATVSTLGPAMKP